MATKTRSGAASLAKEHVISSPSSSSSLPNRQTTSGSAQQTCGGFSNTSSISYTKETENGSRKSQTDSSKQTDTDKDRQKTTLPDNQRKTENGGTNLPDKTNSSASSDQTRTKSEITSQKSISRVPSDKEIDVILARKISSTDLNNGARPKKKISIISAVEEDPCWRDIGEVEVLRRTKCRRLYSKLGQNKDLALFYRSGNFYAMEAWCSHMGGPLFEGDIEEYKGSCHVMCPWHAYMFELTTGRSDIGLKQQVFPVKCEGGHVFVEYISPLALYPFL